IYLRRAIHCFVDDFGDEMDEFRLSEEEWEEAEVLLAFLMPFQRCSQRFESNASTPEIDYVFFAYDSLYNHIDDVKAAFEDDTVLGHLKCSAYMLRALNEMENTLRRYYMKTSFPTVYGDAMILNPRCKLSIFEEETWQDEVDQYSSGCRRR